MRKLASILAHTSLGRARANHRRGVKEIDSGETGLKRALFFMVAVGAAESQLCRVKASQALGLAPGHRAHAQAGYARAASTYCCCAYLPAAPHPLKPMRTENRLLDDMNIEHPRA